MSKFNPWQYPDIIEERYNRDLNRLLADMQAVIKKGITVYTPDGIIGLLQQFAASEEFRSFIMSAVSRMVTGLLANNARSWKEAAGKSMHGRLIYQYLQKEMYGPVGMKAARLIRSNAALISTFPLSISESVARYAAQEFTKGRRSENITNDLIEQFPNVAKSRIRLIARTETSKASTALTESRSRSMGLNWYVWRTSKDARVRDSHRLMDRVLVSWDDPASPEALHKEKRTYGAYHPGNIFNCRCYPQPLIRVDDVKWPCKVYRYGSISMMTRNQFIAMSGGGFRDAA